MTAPFTILGPETGCGAAAEGIMRALPAWFGIEQAIIDYAAAADRLPTLLATIERRTVGFMTIEQHVPGAAELHVLGVLKPHHRSGAGRALLDAGETWLRDLGCRWLQVKTLAPQRQCEHYAHTRLWYEAMGFEPLQVFPLLWDEANPCLQMIKRL